MLANILTIVAAIWVSCSCIMFGYVIMSKRFHDDLTNPSDNPVAERLVATLFGPLGLGMLIAQLEEDINKREADRRMHEERRGSRVGD